MNDLPFRCRFARRTDFPHVLKLLTQDRNLFQGDTWATLPDLLPDLIERHRLLSCVVDDLDSGRPAFFGITAWAAPATVTKTLAGAPKLFRDALLRAESDGVPVFLSPKHLPAANASGQLALLHLGGCPDEKDFTQPRGFEIHRLAFEFFMTVHAGYQISEFWQENHLPEASLYAESMGMVEVHQRPLAQGTPARLFRFTREDSIARPGAQLAYLMKYPPPRLGFTQSQQRLLELALLDYSDPAAAEELGITLEAVRKRWRTIHARHQFGEGKEQRRALLGYLRQHLEELRPWPVAKASAASSV